MVEYDIHDPSDATRTRTSSSTPAAAGPGPTGEGDTPTAVNAQFATRHTGDTTESAPSESPASESADASDVRDGDHTQASPQSASRGDESLADLIAAADAEFSDDGTASGTIPDDLTLGEFTAVINNSNTIHEVKQHLEMSQSNARQLLRDLNLIDIVTNRLAANQINLSNQEVLRRMNAEDT
jgi:hypothetical protein